MRTATVNKLFIIAAMTILTTFSASLDANAFQLYNCGTIISSGSYVLQNNVTSNGTCFSITAQNVILDLNGHTVTYDNAAPITVPNGSFESALSGSWDMTNAPNASQAAGTFIGSTVSAYDGSYAVRFALPATNQYFESANTVTLEANTTYSLSAMFRNSGNNESTENAAGSTRDPLQMSIEITGTAHKATKTGVTWRGFEYTNVVFTTGASPITGKIRISIANAATSGIKGYAYVDDIRILKARSYGVDLGPNYANARFFTVTNGAIMQGQGNGFESHAINMSEAAGEGFSIDHLTFTTQGINSKAISGYYFKNSTINYNTFNHNTVTIRSRDNYDGATVYLPYAGTGAATGSTVHHNTFNTGPQTAISIVQSAGYPKQQIYNNTITLQTRYTNDFAISASGTIIHDNTVNCGSGNNSCRGIVANGDGTQIYNNTVSVQQLLRNQEYNGCEAYGAYGMQMEYDASNIEVYGNSVTANAGVCEAHAFRANPDVLNAVNNLIHDNTFSAVASGAARATSLKLSELLSGSVNFYSNTFRTNHRWIYLDGGGAVTNPVFTSNRWETTGTLPSPFYPFEVFTWDNTHFTGTFYSNTYGTGDLARFESEVFRVSGALKPDPLSSFTVDGAQSQDTIVPNVTISFPASATTVSSIVALTVNASDNVAVTRVEYYLNNILQGSDTLAPYTFSWDSRTVSNGTYSLYAKAYDAANNVATSATVTVNVNNPVPDSTAPSATVTGPATSSTVKGVVAYTATAADNVGVTRVDFYVKGVLRGVTNTAPYSINWDTTAEPNGAATLQAKAYDAAGNVGSSAIITVTVNNVVPDTIAPVVTGFSIPSTSASLTVPVTSLTATDAVGVTGYLITESSTQPSAVEGGWSSTAPASFTFSSTGTKTAYAWARDVAGNVSSLYSGRTCMISLQAAYEAASAGSTIQLTDATLPGSLTADRSITVRVKGATTSGSAISNGKITIKSGKVVFDRIQVR